MEIILLTPICCVINTVNITSYIPKIALVKNAINPMFIGYFLKLSVRIFTIFINSILLDAFS